MDEHGKWRTPMTFVSPSLFSQCKWKPIPDCYWHVLNVGWWPCAWTALGGFINIENFVHSCPQGVLRFSILLWSEKAGKFPQMYTSHKQFLNKSPSLKAKCKYFFLFFELLRAFLPFHSIKLQNRLSLQSLCFTKAILIVLWEVQTTRGQV